MTIVWFVLLVTASLFVSGALSTAHFDASPPGYGINASDTNRCKRSLTTCSNQALYDHLYATGGYLQHKKHWDVRQSNQAAFLEDILMLEGPSGSLFSVIFSPH